MDELLAYADHVCGPYWRVKAQIRDTMFREQLALHDDPAQFKACHSGRRAGKSDGIPKSSCLDVLDAGPNEVVLLVAETLKKARALHWQNLHAVVASHRLPLTPDKQDHRWVTPAGAAIQFWGLNDPGSVELLRGFKVRSAKVDESATIAPMLPRLVEHVLEPALGDTGGALTLYGSPSVTRAGPWFEICQGAERHKWSVHHWDVRSNPHFRPARGGGEAWLSEVLARNGWAWEHPTFQREYLGVFVDDTTRMVVELDRARDCVTALPADYSLAWRHVVGIDYGYHDSFAITVLAVDPYTTQRYFVHAEKAPHLTYDAAADMLYRVLQQFGATHVVCDPAGGGKPFYETFNHKYGAQLGASVQSANKVAGSLVESIRFLNTELRCGRLKLVLPACAPLADEMQVLPWKDDWRDEVDDAYPQDCVAVGSLVETSAGPVPIEDVCAGDMVLTREGFRSVLQQWEVGTRDTVVVCTNGGRRLRVTADHLVLTEAGWTPAGELQEGAWLWVAGEPLEARSSSTPETSSGGIRTPGRGAIESTSWLRTGDICTARSGSASAVLSLPDATSITSMVTAAITLCRTWLVCQRESICESTRSLLGELMCCARTSKRHSLQRRRGMGARKAAPGIPTMGRSPGRGGPWWRRFASAAVLATSRAARWASSARMPASQPPAGAPVPTMSSASASSAARGLCGADTPSPGLARDRVRCVVKGGSTRVFDLAVEGCHEFFASGVLVHNCFDAARYACMETIAWRPKERPQQQLTPEQRIEREAHADATRRARDMAHPMAQLKARWG